MRDPLSRHYGRNKIILWGYFWFRWYRVCSSNPEGAFVRKLGNVVTKRSGLRSSFSSFLLLFEKYVIRILQSTKSSDIIPRKPNKIHPLIYWFHWYHFEIKSMFEKLDLPILWPTWKIDLSIISIYSDSNLLTYIEDKSTLKIDRHWIRIFFGSRTTTEVDLL